MFTGTVSERGVLVATDGGDLTVAAAKAAARLDPGGALCVSGVRLAVVAVEGDRIRAGLSEETRRRSTLGQMAPGRPVNIELPLSLGDRLDGHLVQGHVDAVGKVVGLGDGPSDRRVWIRPPARVMTDVVPKGSVAVDGVSLTVAEVVRDRFSVALVPATLSSTTLGDLVDGQRVNLETDLAAKVARRYPDQPATALAATLDALPWAGHLSRRVGVEKVVAQLAAGGGAVVWDPAREGEGDVVFAGARLRPESMLFLLTQACSHPTVPCDRARLDRLEIPAMAGAGDHHGTAMHTPVDLASGGTGVSASERAATVRRLASPDARPADFLRPGHVFPLAARDGGLSERRGHTETAVELCRAAGLPTVAVICEVMNPDGTMAKLPELERFALRWGLPLVAVDDVVAWL